MAERIVVQRAKARERTRKYRDRLKGKGIPEARTVDQALIQAAAHLVATGEVQMRGEDWIKIIGAAELVLRQRHARLASRGMIAERIEFHSKGDWIKAAKMHEAAPPPDPEAVKWLAARGLIDPSRRMKE